MIARLIKFNPKKPHFTSESIQFNSRWSWKVSLVIGDYFINWWN